MIKKEMHIIWILCYIDPNSWKSIKAPGNKHHISLWSWEASACSSLKWGLVSPPEIEAKPRLWEHRILTARPVVSDKALGLWLCRKESLQRWKIVKQVFIRRGEEKEYSTCGWVGSERESHPCGVTWITSLGPFFLVSFDQLSYFASCWDRIWYILRSLHVWHTSLNQDRF